MCDVYPLYFWNARRYNRPQLEFQDGIADSGNIVALFWWQLRCQFNVWIVRVGHIVVVVIASDLFYVAILDFQLSNTKTGAYPDIMIVVLDDAVYHLVVQPVFTAERPDGIALAFLQLQAREGT